MKRILKVMAMLTICAIFLSTSVFAGSTISKDKFKSVAEVQGFMALDTVHGDTIYKWFTKTEMQIMTQDEAGKHFVKADAVKVTYKLSKDKKTATITVKSADSDEEYTFTKDKKGAMFIAFGDNPPQLVKVYKTVAAAEKALIK